MKWIFVMLTFSSLSSVYAELPTCDELEKDLFAIEYEIQSSRLKPCGDDNPKSEICLPSSGPKDHYTKKYMQEIQDEYNRAMAALVIEQGIQTIGKALEGSHNSLAAMEEVDIDKVDKYMDVLEDNLRRSKVLYAAMTAVDDGRGYSSFWKVNGFSGNESPSEFLSQMKSSCIEEASALGVADNQVKDSPLCKAIINTDLINSENYFEENAQLKKDLEMLYGFAKAEIKQRGTEGDPTLFYDEHRKKLQISDGLNIDNVVSEYTPKDFEEKYFGSGGKHDVLKKAIENYSKEKSKANAQKVFAAAKDLDEISVNYSQIDLAKDYLKEDKLILDFYQKNFAKPLADLEVKLSTDVIVTDVWKNNTENHAKKVHASKAMLEKGLELEAQSILEAIPNTTCKDPDKALECVKEMCGIDFAKNQTSCLSKDEDLKAQVQNGNFLGNIDKLRTLVGVDHTMDKANKCYSKSTLLDKQNCLADQKHEMTCYAPENSNKRIQCLEAHKALEFCYKQAQSDQQTCLDKKRQELAQLWPPVSNIAKLKQNVLDAQKKLDEFNRSAPFKNLNAQKMLALSALQKKNCIGDQLEVVKYNCKKDLPSVSDDNIVQLSGDLADISIYMDNQQYTAATGQITRGPGSSYETTRNQYMENCDRNNSICRYFHAEADERERREEEERRQLVIQQRSIQSSRAQYQAMKKQKRSGGGGFGTGVLMGVIGNIPNAAYHFGSYQNTMMDVEREKARIDAMEKQYDYILEMNDYYRKNGYPSYYNYNSNWGMNQYYSYQQAQDAFTYNNTFGGYNSYSYYKDSTNPMQFNFTPPVIDTNPIVYPSSGGFNFI